MILMIQGLNPLAFTFHPGGLPINLASLCLQLEKISCLEFRVAWLGLSRILNFSLVHSLQMPFTGLNRGTFFSEIFHSTVGFLPSSFSFQKWVYRVIFPSSQGWIGDKIFHSTVGFLPRNISGTSQGHINYIWGRSQAYLRQILCKSQKSFKHIS